MRSKPTEWLIRAINPILRGWLNYFRIGNCSKCFDYIQWWVMRKVRRNMMKAALRSGFGWERWSDDPETAYFDPLHWDRMPTVTQRLLLFNNTLLGRMLIGPALGLAYFYPSDFRLMRGGNRAVLNSYLSHLAGLILLGAWLYYFTSVNFSWG